jgi:glycosyltransferase involved in cell wall biosynthesis
MSSDPVFFSIVVPTYNRAYLLPGTIESILSQDHPLFELIIVDDGSTDNTEAVVQPYLSDRVHYFKKNNAERAAARNYGSQKARGQYINWLDSDDRMLPGNLSQASAFIQQLGYPEVIAMGHCFQDLSGRELESVKYPSDINGFLYKGNPICNSPVIVRSDIALADPFNEDRELSGSEDYELWLRLGAKYTIHGYDKITVAVVDHDQRSITTMSDPDQLIKRFSKFISYCMADESVLHLLGKHRGYFVMKNYLLLSLDLVIHDHLSLALKYITTSLRSSPLLLCERGFYAFIKHIIFRRFSRQTAC